MNHHELTFTDLIGPLFHMSFIFYCVCGLFGIAAYHFGWNLLLYLDTLLIVLSFISLYGLNFLNSFRGTIWLLVGGVFGWYYKGDLRGICLGIMISVVIRHLLKEIILKLFWAVVNAIDRKQSQD